MGIRRRLVKESALSSAKREADEKTLSDELIIQAPESLIGALTRQLTKSSNFTRSFFLVPIIMTAVLAYNFMKQTKQEEYSPLLEI